MKKTVSVYDFRAAFQRTNRSTQFSYEGLGVLFDYFEEMEQDCGEEMELDVFAICCDYSEGSAKEIAESYDIDIEGLDEDDAFEVVRNYLQREGVFVGETDDSLVYQSF